MQTNDFFLCFRRTKLLACVERAINPEAYMNEVIYDLDALCSSGSATDSSAQKRYTFYSPKKVLKIL